jgi:peptidoglycan/xylan/chitin deacetylase (PgdA/CDA1 family)
MQQFMKKRIKLKELDSTKALILCYHGVTREISQGIENFSGKHINAEIFEEQMDFIARYLNPISMLQLHSDLTSGKFKPGSVAVTFDDGYENNFTNAWPILQKYFIPATIYLTTGYIGNPKPFWVDLIEHFINQYPEGVLSITIKQHPFTYPIDTPQSRIQAVLDIKTKLKKYPIEVAEETVKKIGDQFTSPQDWQSVPNFRIMNWDQIQEMQEDALITVGSHTVNHNLLSVLHPDELEAEVGGARQEIEDALGVRTNLFAYPNGQENDFNLDSLFYLTQSGFSSAVTTIHNFIYIGENPLKLNRYAIGFGQDFPFAKTSRYRFFHFW